MRLNLTCMQISRTFRSSYPVHISSSGRIYIRAAGLNFTESSIFGWAEVSTDIRLVEL